MDRIKIFILAGGFLIVVATQTLFAQEKSKDIREYSLDDLLNVEISSAAKYEQRMGEAPASVTIITAEDIERYGYRTLAEVLRNVRGFYISYDRNYTYLGVRGFGRPTDYNNRILLLVNGHSLNERVFGSAYIDLELGIDLNTVERIEIIRGPGSSLYGTCAMFAVINVITKQVAQIDGLEMACEIGSFGKLRGNIAVGKELTDDLDIYFSEMWGDIKGQNLYYEEFNDPATNHGVAEQLDWEKVFGIQTVIRYKNVQLSGLASAREKGIPTAPWETVFNHPDAQTRDEHQNLEFKYQNDISANKNLMLRASLDRYYNEGIYPYIVEPNFYELSENIWISNEFQYRWDFRSNHRLVFGFEFQNHFRAQYRYWNNANKFFTGNFRHNILSVYIQDEYQLTKKLSVTLGIRRDEYSTIGSATTPRLAMVHTPFKSSTLKLLYGEAFRAPSVYETNYYEAGYQQINPNLKPEKIKTAEAIWEQRMGYGFWATISYYYYRMNNLIDIILLPDSLAQYQNINRVKAQGIEAELTARLKSGFSSYLSYSYQTARDVLADCKLTNSPSHLVKWGVSHRLFSRVYMAVDLLYESNRITVYETKTKPYLLTDLNLSSKLFSNQVKFALKIRNLFDVNYRTPGGFEHVQPAIRQNGRNFTARVEFMF
ncbi:TonB-dependent receptor [candidate division KSB1 bacterium]|nr:MAG: TonB-dependent receptor [candidate division KSB1 bacterium]